MTEEQDIKQKLTLDEIKVEISKIGGFFEQIPEDLKSDCAEHFIVEIVNWGSRNYYEALGILQEAMNSFREISKNVAEEEAIEEWEAEQYENAVNSAKKYRCIETLEIDCNVFINFGDICSIGFAGEDDRYAGGKKYYLFNGDGSYSDICQGCLDEYFELVEEENNESICN